MPIIDLSHVDWKEYENLVCEALTQENQNLIIEQNIKIIGHLSNQRRQVDIALRGQLAGHDILAVVDCKKYSRKINVRDVGSFITFLNDVCADIGILVTQYGYTKAAETLAKKSRVKLDIRTVEELKEYSIILDYCDECGPDEDHLPGIISWGKYRGLEGDIDKVKDVGYCDWCDTLHFRCLQCNAVTGIPEAQFGESIECLGGCGTIFIVRSYHAGHGMFEINLTVQNE